MVHKIMVSKKAPLLNSVRCRQKGTTLVVVMVVLVVMTFLGLGAMSDTNIQLSMVRNSQLQSVVHTATQTELQAQINAINANPVGASDQVMINLVNANLAAGAIRTLNIGDGSGAFELLFDDLIGTSEYNNLYSLGDVVLTQIGVNNVQPVIGFSIDNGQLISATPITVELQSTLTINNTRTSSTQVQGFNYLSAN